MAIIYVYPLKAIPSAEDLIVITDSTSSNPQEATKNISIASLGTLINTNTTYDLTSVQNGSDSDIKLTGSDASVDIVKLVAGTNISLVDSGSNITINSTGGGGGSGTVTSVGATNAMGASSGITFVTNPVPITGAGTVDLSFNGVVGDILYADTTTSLNLLPAATAGYVLQSGGPGVAPLWQSKDITIQDEGVNVETATTLIDFTGAGVTATTTGAGLVRVDIPGGGGVTEGSGTFVPCLVTQGINGTGTLEELVAKTGTMTYVEQFGRWYIINKQIYFDFQIAFTLGPEPSATAVIDTLGISAYNAAGATPEAKVLGLENIDALLANLNLTKNHNAGIDICDAYSYGGPTSTIKGWDHMPQGGKLNKFYGDGTTSNKSVAWLHWLAQPTPGGNMSTQYDVPVADGTWVSMDSNGEFIRTFYIAGSLNPIIYQED